MSTRNALLTACVLGVLTLTGCGSSAKVSTATTSTTAATLPASQPSDTGTTPTTVTVPTTTGPSGATGANAFTIGPVPAVTGATDLTKEPVVAAGTAPAPTILTGQDLVVGTGATPSASDMVMVQYVGALYSTGKVFDASWTDSGPTSFSVDGVVPGFEDALLGMKVGGRREVVIPPALGYGATGYPPSIPANATLVFVIDLLGVT